MPRHASAPEDPPATSRHPTRLGSIVSPVLSSSWLWCARALLAALIVAITLCRVTGASIDDLPMDDDSGPFLPQFTFILCIVAGILSTYVFLPHSFAGMTRRSGHLLVGRTVLGPRKIDLRRARAFEWSIPTPTGTVEMVVLVGRPAGLMIVSTGYAFGSLGLDHLIKTSSDRHQANRLAARIVRVLLSSVLPLIVLMAFALAVIVLLTGIALVP